MSVERRLSVREQVILRALVEEYIRTAEPVASKQLSDQLSQIYGAGLWCRHRPQRDGCS